MLLISEVEMKTVHSLEERNDCLSSRDVEEDRSRTVETSCLFFSFFFPI